MITEWNFRKSIAAILLAGFGAARANATTCTTSVPETTCTVVSISTVVPTDAPVLNSAAAGAPWLHVWAGHALTDSLGMPSYGYSEATVHTQFVKVQNYNWSPEYNLTRTIQANFWGLTDVELARLTKQYVVEGGNLATLVGYIAPELTPLGQRRLAAATSDAFVEDVLAREGAAYVAAFEAAPVYATIGRSYRNYVEAGLDPAVALPMGLNAEGLPVIPPPSGPIASFGMTLYEIYLDFRTGGLALDAAGALYASSAWAIDILGAVGYGSYRGTQGVLWLADQLSPGFSDWLSSELGAGIYNVVSTFETPTVSMSAGCGCSVTVEWDELTEVEKD